MHLCVFVCVCGDQTGGDTYRVGFVGVVNHQKWVLGIEPRPFPRADNALNHWATSPALTTVLKRKENYHSLEGASGVHQPHGTMSLYLDPYFSGEKAFLRELGKTEHGQRIS